MKQLLTPIYETVGGLTSQQDSADRLDVVKHHVLIASWACKYEVADCVSDAEALFEKFMENPDDAAA